MSAKEELKVKIGQKWRLRRTPEKVATILEIHGDYIVLDMPWGLRRYNGKSRDTLLKYYERVR